MASLPFEDLVHRVNNLLGTILLQCDVARTAGTLHAHQEALRFIEESARRVRQDLARLRAQAPGSAADEQ